MWAIYFLIRQIKPEVYKAELKFNVTNYNIIDQVYNQSKPPRMIVVWNHTKMNEQDVF